MSAGDAAKRAIDADGPAGNELLDTLPAPMRARVLDGAERVHLERGRILFAPGTPLNDVYFPITCVCSFLLTLESGQSAETSAAGSEGMVGVHVVIGGAPNQSAIVQVTGEAWKLRGEAFREQLDMLTEFRAAVREYVGYLYRVAQQSSLCNAYHSVEQRLARWLLTARDRAGSDRFPLTQQLLSEMVAATRPRVGECLARLRAVGFIAYRRGWVEVTNAPGLAKVACECYALTRRKGAGSR